MEKRSVLPKLHQEQDNLCEFQGFGSHKSKPHIDRFSLNQVTIRRLKKMKPIWMENETDFVHAWWSTFQTQILKICMFLFGIHTHTARRVTFQSPANIHPALSE